MDLLLACRRAGFSGAAHFDKRIGGLISGERVSIGGPDERQAENPRVNQLTENMAATLALIGGLVLVKNCKIFAQFCRLLRKRMLFFAIWCYNSAHSQTRRQGDEEQTNDE